MPAASHVQKFGWGNQGVSLVWAWLGFDQPCPCRLVAEAVEELGIWAALRVRFYQERPFGFHLGSMPGRFWSLGAMGSRVWRMNHAMAGVGGGPVRYLASRFKFCTVAAGRNSSRAPVRPLGRSRVRARFVFTSPNGLSTFLRCRAQWR